MKKFLLIVVALGFSVSMFGCAKKETSEESIEIMSMEALSAIPPSEPVTEVATQTATPTQLAKLEPLPPAGPYKPTAKEIQTALKNAGYYTGVIDGKIGPVTKNAAKEFQKANGLEADGKVGPKTWAVLSQYLNPAPQVSTTPAKRR